MAEYLVGIEERKGTFEGNDYHNILMTVLDTDGGTVKGMCAKVIKVKASDLFNSSGYNGSPNDILGSLVTYKLRLNNNSKGQLMAVYENVQFHACPALTKCMAELAR